MVKSIDIETVCARQKEVFDAYTLSRGREQNLLKFLRKYSIEDSENHTLELIWHYINMYLNSNRITEEEKERYERSKKVPASLATTRGKEITETLITTNGAWNQVVKLGLKYAKEDGKLEPYSKAVLIKFRDYYLKNTNDSNLVEMYETIMYLSERTGNNNYDIELLNKLISFSIKEAVFYIRMIGISQRSLLCLRETFQTLYPANKTDLALIDAMIDAAFFKPSNGKKRTSQQDSFLRQRLNRLKSMLDEYLIQDIDDITTLYPKYGFTSFKFTEAIKDAVNAKDKVLLGLIDKYAVKEKIIFAQKEKIVETIRKGIYEGVNYGNGFRTFNLFDYFSTTTMSFEEFERYSFKINTMSKHEKIMKFLRTKFLGRIYDESAELLEIAEYSYKGKSLTLEDKYLLIEFFERMGWPLSLSLFYDTARRYLEGDLVIQTLEMPEENENQRKM